jgi:hypothetical protein
MLQVLQQVAFVALLLVESEGSPGDLLSTDFHEKAISVKADVAAITMTGYAGCPCHASIRSLCEPLPGGGSVHYDVRLFEPVLQSH